MAKTTIRVEGMVAEGRHGANPRERDEPQDFVVDLEVEVEVDGDSLEDTVDYRLVADTVREVVAETSFVLLESVAHAIAAAVFELPRVVSATAVVHKPGAADDLGVDDVAAEATVGR